METVIPPCEMDLTNSQTKGRRAWPRIPWRRLARIKQQWSSFITPKDAVRYVAFRAYFAYVKGKRVKEALVGLAARESVY